MLGGVRDIGSVRELTRGMLLRTICAMMNTGKTTVRPSFSSFYYSGSRYASDCGSAHCNGCMSNGISARTAC